MRSVVVELRKAGCRESACPRQSALCCISRLAGAQARRLYSSRLQRAFAGDGRAKAMETLDVPEAPSLTY